MSRDMPAHLPGSLPHEVMQSMTAGEEMEIARKNLTSLNIKWSTPVVMASNHMPDYVNTGNNVGRRLVTFRLDKVITNPDEQLKGRMLSNIYCEFHSSAAMRPCATAATREASGR